MIHAEKNGAILHVRLQRPEVRNALNDELIQALTDTFRNLDPDVRAIILSGDGKSFCAGADLQWMKRSAEFTHEQNVAETIKVAELFESMLQCPAVIIAVVHGAAFGGGAGLVAAADVALAVEDTKFSFSEVKLGLVAATISTFVVPKIGPGHARALFTTGEAFSTERALHIGLIHEIISAEHMESAGQKKAFEVLKNGPQAVAKSKLLVQQPSLTKVEAAKLLADVRVSEEGKEGIDAFLNKRKASYVIED